MWWVDIEVPNDSVDKSSWESSACYPRRTFYPLSDGPSTRDHRITMTDFRLCSTCQSRSQAGLCHCTLTDGFQPSWAHHRAPPLLFRRRPPQSNYPPQRVPAPDNGARLDIRKQQGGISPMAPLRLAPKFQSLPPMLHSSFLMPLWSCSKGARGLSV